MNFKDYNIFILGGTGGIGSVIAKSFLSLGATVYIHARSENKLNLSLKSLSGYKDKINGISCDLSTDEGVDVLKKYLDSIKQVDVLICAVGNGNVKKGIDLTRLDWNDIVSQNLYSATLTIPLFINKMKLSKNPSIVTIGSIVSESHINAPIAYATSKSALKTYSKYLSFELSKDKIRVNCVLPGNIYFKGGRWEELRNNDPEKVDKYIKDNVLMSRFGTPEDIANVVLFLSSENSNFINGSSIVVDGGQTNTI